MNDETTLGLAAGSDGLPARIAEYARKVAKTAAETNRDGFLTKQIESLGTAAEFITSRGRFDPRIYGLWAIAGCFGDANHFEPRRGGKQAHLFQQIGTIRGRPVPLPETTLNELLAARVFDLIEHFAAIQVESHTKVDQALRKQEAAEAAQTGALADAEELQRVSDELATAEASLVSKEEQLDHLNGVLRTQLTKEAKAKGKPRRISLEEHPGIYVRPTPEGDLPREDERIFEIGFPDDKGKQKWKTVGTDLNEAIALRKELAGKPYEAKEAVIA